MNHHRFLVSSTLHLDVEVTVGLIDQEATVVGPALWTGECGSILIILYIGPHVAVWIPCGIQGHWANQAGVVGVPLLGLHRALHYGYGS